MSYKYYPAPKCNFRWDSNPKEQRGGYIFEEPTTYPPEYKQKKVEVKSATALNKNYTKYLADEAYQKGEYGYFPLDFEHIIKYKNELVDFLATVDTEMKVIPTVPDVHESKNCSSCSARDYCKNK